MDIISKYKKELQLKGLPHTSLNDIEELKIQTERLRLNKLEKKAAYLQELEEQFTGLQNLIQRNGNYTALGMLQVELRFYLLFRLRLCNCQGGNIRGYATGAF